MRGVQPRMSLRNLDPFFARFRARPSPLADDDEERDDEDALSPLLTKNIYIIIKSKRSIQSQKEDIIDQSHKIVLSPPAAEDGRHIGYNTAASFFKFIKHRYCRRASHRTKRQPHGERGRRGG